MQSASESPQSSPPSGRLHRARALYRNVSKRRTAWLLLKDTVNSCMEYRILGLAAEAAFFTLLSVPPLLLSLIGLLGYVDAWTGAHSIASLRVSLSQLFAPSVSRADVARRDPRAPKEPNGELL